MRSAKHGFASMKQAKETSDTEGGICFSVLINEQISCEARICEYEGSNVFSLHGGSRKDTSCRNVEGGVPI